jgi:hypothetical protein
MSDRIKVCPQCGWQGATQAVVCAKDATLLLPLQPSSKIKPDPVIGLAYEIVREISRDEKWIVYDAIQKMIRKNVRIRVLISSDISDVKAFEAEAQKLSATNQPSPEGTLVDFGVCEKAYPFAVFIPSE